MRDNDANMQHNYVNMRDNFVNMQHYNDKMRGAALLYQDAR